MNKRIMNKSIIFICYILVIVILLANISIVSQAQEEHIGVVTAVEGDVRVTSEDGREEAVLIGTKVFTGDHFVTGTDSSVKIIFEDDTLISLGADTDFQINEFVYNPKKRSVINNIVKGKLRSIIQKFEGDESLILFKTRNAVSGVKGTTIFIDADEELFLVLEGKMFVRGIKPGSKEVELGPKEFTRIVNGNPTDPQTFTELRWDELETQANSPEKPPDTYALFKAEYPGKVPLPIEIPHSVAADRIINSTTQFPTAPPVDLTPGVSPGNQVSTVPPVDLTPGVSPGNQVPPGNQAPPGNQVPVVITIPQL